MDKIWRLNIVKGWLKCEIASSITVPGYCCQTATAPSEASA